MRVQPKHGLNLSLRNPSVELVQSSVAVDVNGFLAPNLEYALSGLTCYGNSENWRFLHQIFFRLEGHSLKQKGVDATAEKISFEYDCLQNGVKKNALRVSYELAENCLRISLKTSRACGNKVFSKVFADIRQMYAESGPFEHQTEKNKRGLTVSRKGRTLKIYSDCAESVSTCKRALNWWFPADNEEREVFEAGELVCRLPCTLVVECSPCASHALPDFSLPLVKIKPAFSKNELLTERLKSISTFALNGFPEAGGLWFRNNWFRDAFEGLLQNYGFYCQTNQETISNALRAAKKTFKDGLVANKLPENASEKISYNALDSTLLYYLLCLKRGVFSLQEFEQTMMRLRNRESEVFLDGLLYCPANYSWTDELADLDGKKFPTRIPKDWLSFNSEPCALIEINALWQSLLQEGKKIRCSGFEDLALEHKLAFEKNFLPNFPHAICEGKEASDFHSAKIMALALLELPPSFVKKQFELAKPFLAFKNNKLFGVAVNPSSDFAYQGKSVWPRDNPYLLRVLEKLGLKREYNDLLQSSLEQTGACLFYSQECFSFPDLKPLKNPIQYWSHFVQPFLE